jgi:type I restriction enzyme S subunit
VSLDRTAVKTVVLRELLLESKDGEWGKDYAPPGAVKMVVIRGTDFETVRLGDLTDVPVRFIPERIAQRKTLRPLDVLIETAGGSKDRPTGRTLLVTRELLARAPHPATCASFSRFLRVDPEKADPRFVFWLLQALYQGGQLRQYHTQHTGVARFQFTTFADREPLPLPPIPAQRRIASILSAYDDLIQNNTRRIAILEEMASTLYREWFVEFRFPGHEKVRMVESEIGRIPSGWRAAKLSELADVNARSIRRGAEPKTVSYVDIASVSTGAIEAIQRMPFSEAPGRARRLVQDGDTIWSCVRPNRRSFSLVLDPDPELVVSTGFAVLTPKAVPFAYIYLAVTTEEFTAYLTNHAQGAAYPAVTATDFENAVVLKPGTSIVDRFQDTVEPLLRLKETLRRKNLNLRTTRDLLLPKLVSGEIDVSTIDGPVPDAVRK